MRQSIALGITKLISARAANFGNLIRIFSCRAQGTFSRVLGGQGNLTHDPVPNLESTGFDLTHDPVPKLVNEVKVPRLQYQRKERTVFLLLRCGRWCPRTREPLGVALASNP
ncbi:unnamed protein product [Prunus armeniaca]